MPRTGKPDSRFCAFTLWPAVIRLVLLMGVRVPLSRRNVDSLIVERGIDLCRETARM